MLELRICANPDCKIEFEPAIHNQIYHNPECCKIVTNKRIMDKYYERKARKNSRVSRKCVSCGNKLNKYNETEFCSSCQNKVEVIERGKLLDMVGHG